MQELIPNPKLLEICEELNNETWKCAQPLQKGPVKPDHNNIRQMLETAMIVTVLREIRDELRFANHEKRMAQFPNSMFSTAPQAHNKE